MFLYICENKRPDRTGENHYTTTSRSNPPTIEELMTQKEIPTAANKKTKIRSLGMWTRSFFLFALLVEGKKNNREKAAANNHDTNNNNHDTNDNNTTTTPTTTHKKPFALPPPNH